MPRNFQGYTAKLIIKGTVIISVPSCTTIDYNIQLNARNVFKQLREQVTVVHQLFPVGFVTPYFTENFGALRMINPKLFVLLLLILKLKGFDTFDLILGHLGWSNAYLSRTDYPTIQNSASAMNLGIETFYANGGSKDINVR